MERWKPSSQGSNYLPSFICPSCLQKKLWNSFVSSEGSVRSILCNECRMRNGQKGLLLWFVFHVVCIRNQGVKKYMEDLKLNDKGSCKSSQLPLNINIPKSCWIDIDLSRKKRVMNVYQAKLVYHRLYTEW